LWWNCRNFSSHHAKAPESDAIIVYRDTKSQIYKMNVKLQKKFLSTKNEIILAKQCAYGMII
jgi:hypothetical protein